MTREASAGRLTPVAPWPQSRLCPAPGQQLWVSYFRLAMIRALIPSNQRAGDRQLTNQRPLTHVSAKVQNFRDFKWFQRQT